MLYRLGGSRRREVRATVCLLSLLATLFWLVPHASNQLDHASRPPNRIPPSSSVYPLRPVHTFSIVARDPATGELGVAVQSHWFSVGPTVAWAEAGVGAVATQSFVDPSYGKLGLDLMRAGRSAPEALKALLAGDEGREMRQRAMIDAKGRVQAHTGAKNIPGAGNLVGKDY